MHIQSTAYRFCNCWVSLETTNQAAGTGQQIVVFRQANGIWQLLQDKRPKLTLNLGGKDRKSFTRRHNPIKVAMLQCSTVGVNCTLQPVHNRLCTTAEPIMAR